jgi:hypothetical protein
MAKTPSLKATSRPGSRCTEGESCPALPPGARAVANDRVQGITDVMRGLLAGDGIVQLHRPGRADLPSSSPGTRSLGAATTSRPGAADSKIVRASQLAGTVMYCAGC